MSRDGLGLKGAAVSSWRVHVGGAAAKDLGLHLLVILNERVHGTPFISYRKSLAWMP